MENFYVGRMGRLLPPYFLMLLLMVAWFAYNGVPTVLTSAIGLPVSEQATLIFLNLSLLGQDLFQAMVDVRRAEPDSAAVRYMSQVFSPDFYQTHWMLIGQAWSLSTELLFYICAPFIVRSPRRVVLLLVLSFGLRMVMIHGLGMSSALWGGRVFPLTLCIFLLGAGAYHVGKAMEGRLPLRAMGVGFLASFSAFSIWALYANGRILYTDDYDTVGFWLTYLVFAAALPCVFALTREWRSDRTIGDLSYPVYLVHGLVIGLIYSADDPFPDTMIRPAVALAASLCCGFLVHQIVERPALFAVHGRGTGWGVGRTVGALGLTIALIASAVLVTTWRSDQSWVRHYPRFVETRSSYNILAYGERFLAIPHGMTVDWSRDDIPRLRGTVMADTLDAVRESVEKRTPYYHRPRFLSVVGNHNLVSFRGVVYALPHGVAVDLEAEEAANKAGVFVGDSEMAVLEYLK